MENSDSGNTKSLLLMFDFIVIFTMFDIYHVYTEDCKQGTKTNMEEGLEYYLTSRKQGLGEQGHTRVSPFVYIRIVSEQHSCLKILAF